jgi:hypothetical protein
MTGSPETFAVKRETRPRAMHPLPVRSVQELWIPR